MSITDDRAPTCIFGDDAQACCKGEPCAAEQAIVQDRAALAAPVKEPEPGWMLLREAFLCGLAWMRANQDEPIAEWSKAAEAWATEKVGTNAAPPAPVKDRAALAAEVKRLALVATDRRVDWDCDTTDATLAAWQQAWREFLASVDRLAALAAPSGTPEGWKLVPVEPTDAMLTAAADTPGMKAIDGAAAVHQLRGYRFDTLDWGDRSPLQQAWDAMLGAAPTAAPSGTPDGLEAEIDAAAAAGRVTFAEGWEGAEAAPQAAEQVDDDYYDEEAEYDCTHCGGEGYREVDDPLLDDCDEFGYGPCSSCRGTGLRSKQWVF